MEKLVQALYEEKNFERVEDHISRLLSVNNEKNGYELYSLYNILGHATDLKHLELMQDVLNEWCNGSSSHIPWMVRGIFNMNMGSKIRGGGRASTVSRKAKKEFHEYLNLAKMDFENAYSLNPDDSNSSCHLITMAMGLGKSIKIIEEIYQKGLDANPYHYALHYQMFVCLTPKWGGSYQSMMDFADECMSFPEEHPYLGLIKAYTLVEVHNNIAPEKQKFLKQEMNWSRVENIYKDFFRKYSDNILRRFTYAYHALLANENEIAIEGAPITIWQSA